LEDTSRQVKISRHLQIKDEADSTWREESLVNTVTNQTLGGTLKVGRQPFANEILEVELLPRWKGLTMDRYDGTMDPDEHVDIFTT